MPIEIIDYTKINPKTGCLEQEQYENALRYVSDLTKSGRYEVRNEVLRRLPSGDLSAILNELVEGSRIVF